MSGSHPTIEGAGQSEMKRAFSVALVLAGCLAALSQSHAQTPASDASGPAQTKPADSAQKKAGAAPQPDTNANPFPEDTSSVPVMPAATAPVLPTASDSEPGSGSRAALPGEDYDPARSPDDPVQTVGSGDDESSSSSLTGIDKLLPPPDSEQPEKKKKKEPTHQEAAVSDVEVGGYYLDRKNWKAALSRFQSAMVLDPENPEVYWGLAEAEHRLGNLAEARAYYLKLLDYDPDGPHSKQARKALKEPEIANAKAASAAAPTAESPK
jgi:tetratricopeptide (TPR) repeat protein